MEKSNLHQQGVSPQSRMVEERVKSQKSKVKSQKLLLKLFVLAFIVHCSLLTVHCYSQGVGINTTGNPADNSAMLDVSSTNLGILIPRMTTAQMNAISSPATGLIIYNTDCNNLNYNAGTPGSPNWVTIKSTAGTPGNITGSASICANQAGVTYSIAAVSGATSYNWTVPTGAIITAGTGTSGITVTFGTNGGNVCVSAVNSCGTSNASCITVTVYNGNLTAGTISSNQTICSGATPSALTFTTPPTGGIGAYTYQWYNGTGSLGSAATNSTYSPGALTASGIITTESFDGTTFPPTGWGNTVISDPDCPGASSLYCPFSWMRTTGGVWITEDLNIPESPHSGTGEAWYDSWDAAVGDEAILVSPSFSETGNTGATVSFWMFGSNPYPNSTDLVNVWYSTSPTQPTSISGATLLGTVNRYNATDGWYQHTYTIPSSVTSSTVWLIFDAVSAFGAEMYIDDVSWTSPASYYCSVTSGCTVTTNTVTVSVNASPTAFITGTTTICSGNSTTLTGSGVGTYLWSTGDTTAAITASPTSNTTYTVTVTNGTGCSATASVTVMVYDLTAGTISSNQTICSGGTPSALTFTTSPTGGTGIYTYQWYNASGSISGATNSTYSPGALTSSGIITTESFDGTTFPPTGWGNTVISDPDCPGASSLYCPFAWMRTTNSPYNSILPYNGSAGEAWYDSHDAAVGDEAILVSPSFSEILNTSGATVSFWMYSLNRNPGQIANVNVWYSTSPTQPTTTSGAIMLGTVPRYYSSPSGWYQHTYTIPSSVTSTTVWLIFDAVVVSNNGNGWEMCIDDVSWTAFPSAINYYCSVTSGCTATTNTVTIAVNALPTVSISPTSATICSGNSTTLSASGGGTYLWSTGDKTATITENPTYSTTYTVTVTNGVGCSATASATVTVNTGVPTPPVAGTNTPSMTQIVWNWSTVSGATGYRWGTTSSYSSATDVGTSTSYTQTGLTCNTSYTLYVWAYNACGNSSYTIFTQPTTQCCGGFFTVIHTAGTIAPVTRTVTYGTVLTTLTGASECWITQNLGAINQASSDTDATDAAAGWYWEWDTQQGYDNNGTTLTPSTWADTYGTDTSWVTANDPCNLLLNGNGQSGWRIPTYTEWNNVQTTLDPNDNIGYSVYFSSVLKLHAAGDLDFSDGSLSTRGSYGNYWSSRLGSGGGGFLLYFLSDNSSMGYNSIPYGYSLRCLRD